MEPGSKMGLCTLGIREQIEDMMIERMAENDKIVTRYMSDAEFQRTAFRVLAREIFDPIHQDLAGDGEAARPKSTSREGEGG